MKTKTLSERKSRASDRFSSILVFCPNWPALAQTNTAKKFNQLIDFIDAIAQKIKGDDAKQWLRICLQEIRQSWKYYEDGNLKEGRELIQQAEEHFNNAFLKKPVEARFIASESGAALDSEKGFPS